MHDRVGTSMLDAQSDCGALGIAGREYRAAIVASAESHPGVGSGHARPTIINMVDDSKNTNSFCFTIIVLYHPTPRTLSSCKPCRFSIYWALSDVAGFGSVHDHHVHDSRPSVYPPDIGILETNVHVLHANNSLNSCGDSDAVPCRIRSSGRGEARNSNRTRRL